MCASVQKDSRRLGHDELVLAARLRYIDGLSWDRVAQRMECHRNSLLHARKHRPDEWGKAKSEVLDEMKAEGSETAWGCLLRMARANDVTAAKEVLDRIEGKVNTPISATVEGGLDVNVIGRLQPETREAILHDLNGHDPAAASEADVADEAGG